MKHKIGSNQHQTKQKYAPIVYGTLIILTLLVWIIGREWTITHPVKSPCADTGCFVKVIMAKEPLTRDQQIDVWVNHYAFKYAKDRWTYIRTKALMHYLLLREQGYGGSDARGDGGLAAGPLQYHEATYQGYRAIMIKRGLVKDVGSRLDMENAIETTAWAINDGREVAWGPVYRGEIKL